jgi:hypothetical protein
MRRDDPRKTSLSPFTPPYHTIRPACADTAEQAKRAPKPAANYIALRGEPQGRTLVVRGHGQARFGFKMKTEVLKK